MDNIDYITLKEIKDKYSTLNTRNLNKICKKYQNAYPTFIIGGGQGKMYKVHKSIINIFERRRSSRNTSKEIQDYKIMIAHKELFFNTNWKYYITLKPAKDLSEKDLINLVPKTIYKSMFYGIHISPLNRNDKKHIHLLIDSDKSYKEIKRFINSQIKFMNTYPFIHWFDESKRDNLFLYLTEREKYNYGYKIQITYDWGYVKGEYLLFN
jgi:hypothetical protein